MTPEQDKKPALNWLSILFLVMVALVIGLFSRPLYPPSVLYSDSRLVYVRYVEQLQAGNGAVFNRGERVLLVPAPLYLGLAGLLTTIGFDASTAQLALHVFAVWVALFALIRLAQQLRYSAWTLFAGLIFLGLAWPIVAGDVTGYPLAAALLLWVLWASLQEKWLLAGSLLGLATLSAPESILFAIPLLIRAAQQSQLTSFGVGLLIPLIVGTVALWAYYGPQFWDGLFLPKDNVNWRMPEAPLFWMVFEIGFTSICLVIFAILGWFRAVQYRSLAQLCLVWMLCYVVLIGGFLRVDAIWRYGLLAVPLVILATLGIHEAPQRTGLRRMVGPIIISLVFVLDMLFRLSGIIDFFGPSAIAEWDKPSIGVTSSNVIYFHFHYWNPSQQFIGFDGQLQPELKTMIERGDTQSAVIRYAPDTILFDQNGRLQPDALGKQAIKRLGYSSVKMEYPLSYNPTYKRTIPVGTFAPLTPLDLAYGPDIRLSGYSLDRVTLHPGEVARVRLDWQLARPASKPITVDLRLRSGEFLLAHSVDTFEPGVFPAGPWSTYHTLQTIGEAWPGPTVLEIGVTVSDGVIARWPLATIEVVTP